MSEPVERGGLAVSRIQNGLRETTTPRKQAVTIADRITRYDEQTGLDLPLNENEEIPPEELKLSKNTLRRTRKIAEIIEDESGVDVGHRKFTRMATTASKLTSLGAIAIAARNLVDASWQLRNRYEKVGSVEDLNEEPVDQFYRASCILVVECMLISTPMTTRNYKVAWRGTRYVNNQYLYHLRMYAPNLHRYVLSEIHYLIRGIGPAALRSIGQYSDYLIETAVSTVRLLWDFGREDDNTDVDLTDVPGLVKDVVDEFHKFAQSAYSISLPDLPDLDEIYEDVLDEVEDFIDSPLPRTNVRWA